VKTGKIVIEFQYQGSGDVWEFMDELERLATSTSVVSILFVSIQKEREADVD
jgi:hypothetical protein